MEPALLHVIAIALMMIVVVTGIVQAGELRMTEDQRFYVNGSWVRASDLKPGDIVETYDGKRVRITNVTDVMSDTPLQVYGFTTNNMAQSYVLTDGILTSDDTGGLTSSTARVSVWREWWWKLVSFWHTPLRIIPRQRPAFSASSTAGSEQADRRFCIFTS